LFALVGVLICLNAIGASGFLARAHISQSLNGELATMGHGAEELRSEMDALEDTFIAARSRMWRDLTCHDAGVDVGAVFARRRRAASTELPSGRLLLDLGFSRLTSLFCVST
jgi:hypothetical protein